MKKSSLIICSESFNPMLYDCYDLYERFNIIITKDNTSARLKLFILETESED